MEREVRILVDGREIPLAPFVERLVGETVAALIGSLKGGEGGREISVSIRPKRS